MMEPILCSRCAAELPPRGTYEVRRGAGFCPVCRFWEVGPGIPLSEFPGAFNAGGVLTPPEHDRPAVP